MKSIQQVIAAAAIAAGLSAPASAATTDPEIVIYRFPGVRDNGGAQNTGVATAFHCTNFSGALEQVRFVTRLTDSTLVSNQTLFVGHLQTPTAMTHLTAAYLGANLATGPVVQGTTAISATSINIICTAMTIDASTAAPLGVALRGIRFSPIPGSQE